MASVIVVEDEPEIRTFLGDVLTQAGFATLNTATADAAAQLLRLHQDDIHLLVTDIDMPGALDGVALAKVARRQCPGMPVIFISGHPIRLRNAWTFTGPTAVFHKPFSFRMLVTAAQGFVQP
ncbi:MAG TPA: response regulator [Rhodopila sp.]|jgi:DNA-binding response OmpR family regulator|nr:response regulator [Rhodopila sp.]